MSEEITSDVGAPTSEHVENVAVDNGSTQTDAVQNTEQVDEPKISQSQVNAIVAKESDKAARRAAEKIQREYEARIASMQAQQGGETQQQTEKQPSFDELMEAYEQKKSYGNFATNYVSKINQLRYSDSEFSDAYDLCNIENVAPQLTMHLDKLENFPDVIKEFADKPEKLVSVMQTLHIGPAAVEKSLKRISDSIKQNQKAPSRAAEAPKAPLDQLKPSNLTTGDGKLSVSQLRLKMKGL